MARLGEDSLGKKKKKREKARKIDADRNRGRVFCTVRVVCGGECKELNFKRAGRVCGEAFYKVAEGEITVRN